MANAITYARNIGKSVAYSAINEVKRLNPALTSFAETNADIAKSAYDSVKNLKLTAKKISAEAMESDYASVAKNMISNIKEDIKSGKFYNMEREQEALQKAADSFMDISDYDFGFEDDDEDFGSSSGSSESKTNMMDLVGKKSAEAVSNVVAASAEYTVTAMHKDNKALYDQNRAMYLTMHSGMKTINENLANLVRFAGTPVMQHMENSKTFYENETRLSTERNEILKEIRDLYKSQVTPDKTKSANKKITMNDILDSEGMPDLEVYFNKVKENIKEMSSGTADLMETMFNKDTLNTMIASPLKFITDGLVKSLTPKVMKTAMKDFNKSLSGAFASAMANLNNADDFGIVGIIKNIFGVKPNSKNNYDTSKYEKGAVPFDGITRKSIVEVIPTYLAEIASAVSGNPQKRYNYEEGKFVTLDDVKKYMESKEKSAKNSANADISKYLDAYKKKIKFSSKEQESQFDKDLEAILDKSFKDGKLFNYKKAGNAASYGLKGGKASDLNIKLIKAMFAKMPRNVQLQWASNFYNAKDSLAKSLANEEEKGYSLLANLFNGSMDDIQEVVKKSSSADKKVAAAASRKAKTANRSKAKTTSKKNDYKSWADDDAINYDKMMNAANAEDMFVSSLDGIDDDLSNGTSKMSIADRISNADKLSQKTKKLFNTLDKLIHKPTDILTGMIKKADKAVYDLIFGRDKSNEEDLNKGIGNVIIDKLKENFDKFGQWLDDKIVIPISKKLNGDLFDKVGRNMAQSLGLDYDNLGKSVHDKLFGTKDANGNRTSDGLMGNFFDRMGAEVKDAKNFAKSTVKDAAEAIELTSKLNEKGKSKKVKNSKIDKLMNEFGVGGVENAAGGMKRVSKTGVVAVSEGEMIIPPDMNPYNIDKRLKNENKAKDKYLNYFGDAFDIPNFAKGGTVSRKGPKVVAEGIMNGNVSKESFDKLDPKYQRKVLEELKNMKEDLDESDYEEGRSKSLFGRSMDKIAEGANVLADEFKKYYTDKDGKPVDPDNEKKKMVSDVTAEMKKFFPEMTGGALLGTGISMVTGLIGGPILGAAIGAGVSLVRHSDVVQKTLFGEKVDGERQGGLLSKELSNNIEKYVPAIGKGATLGAITSILPFVPGGPVAGIILGSAAGFATKNEAIHEKLFGEEGLIDKDFQKKVKEALPNMGAGALIGLVAGPFGVTTNLILGSALGFATTTDKFKDVMFGEKDENGERHGGVFKNAVDNMFNPIINFSKEQINGLKEWADKNIKQPLKDAVTPIKEEVKYMFKSIAKGVTGVFNRFAEEHLGAPIDKFLKDKIFKPFTNVLKGFIKGALAPAKFLVSAPFKAVGKIGDSVTSRQVRDGRAGWLSAEQRVKFRETDKNKRFFRNLSTTAQEYEAMDKSIAGASTEQLSDVAEKIQQFKDAEDKLNTSSRAAYDKYNERVRHNTKLSYGDVKKIAKGIKKEIEKDPDTAPKRVRNYVAGLIDLSPEERKEIIDASNELIATYKDKRARLGELGEQRKNLVKTIRSEFNGVTEDNLDKFYDYTKSDIDKRNALANAEPGSKEAREAGKAVTSLPELNKAQKNRHTELMGKIDKIINAVQNVQDPDSDKINAMHEAYNEDYDENSGKYTTRATNKRNRKNRRKNKKKIRRANIAADKQLAADKANFRDLTLANNAGVNDAEVMLRDGSDKTMPKFEAEAMGLVEDEDFIVIGENRYDSGTMTLRRSQEVIRNGIKNIARNPLKLGVNVTSGALKIAKRMPKATMKATSYMGQLAYLNGLRGFYSAKEIKNMVDSKKQYGGVSSYIPADNKAEDQVEGGVQVDENDETTKGHSGVFDKIKSGAKKVKKSVYTFYNGLPVKMIKDRNGKLIIDRSSSDNKEVQAQMDKDKEEKETTNNALRNLPATFGEKMKSLFGLHKDDEKKGGFLSKLFDRFGLGDSKAAGIAKAAGLAIGLPIMVGFWKDTIWPKLEPFVGNFWEKLKENAGPLFNRVIDWFRGEGESEGKGFPSIMGSFIGAWGSGFEYIMSSVVPKAAELITAALPSILMGVLKGASKWFTADLSSVMYNSEKQVDPEAAQKSNYSYEIVAEPNAKSSSGGGFSIKLDENSPIPFPDMTNWQADSHSLSASMKSVASDVPSSYTTPATVTGTTSTATGTTSTATASNAIATQSTGINTIQPSVVKSTNANLIDSVKSTDAYNNKSEIIRQRVDEKLSSDINTYPVIDENGQMVNMTLAEILTTNAVIARHTDNTTGEVTEVRGVDLLNNPDIAAHYGLDLHLTDEEREQITKELGLDGGGRKYTLAGQATKTTIRSFLTGRQGGKIFQKVGGAIAGKRLPMGTLGLIRKAAGNPIKWSGNVANKAGDLGAKYLPDWLIGQSGVAAREKAQREAAEKAARQGTKEGLFNRIKNKGTEFIQNKFGKNVASEAAEEAVEKTGKSIVEEGLEQGSKSAVDQIVEQTGEKVAKEAGEEAVEKTAKEGAAKVLKEATKESNESTIKTILKSIPERVMALFKDSTVNKYFGKVLEAFGAASTKEGAEKLAKEIAEKIANALVKKLPEQLAKASGKVIGKIAASIASAGVANIAFFIADFISGWSNANSIMGVVDDVAEPSLMAKFICGISNALLGILFITSLIPLDFIFKIILEIMENIPAFKAKALEIKEDQEESQKFIDQYNLEHDTNLTIGEYNHNQKWYVKAWNGAKDLGGKALDFVTGGASNDDKVRETLGLSEDEDITLADRGKTFLISAGNGLKSGWDSLTKGASDFWNSLTGQSDEEDEKEGKLNFNMFEKCIQPAFGAMDKKLGSILGMTDEDGNPISLTEAADQTEKEQDEQTEQAAAGPTTLKEAAQGMWDTLNNSVGEKFGKFKDNIGNVVKNLDSKLGSMFGLTDANGNPMTLSEATKNKLAKTKTAVGGVSSAISGVVGSINNLISASGSGLSNFVGRGSGTKGTFISQIDPKYANKSFNVNGDTSKQTLGDTGCGPAAAAMVVNGSKANTLTMEQASKNALKYKVRNSGVSADYFADQFTRSGLQTSYIADKNQKDRNNNIATHLRSGHQVVLMGQDVNNTSKKNSPFGPNSHYIVANKISDDGRYIWVNDPESKKANVRYDANRVLNSTTLGVAGYAASGSGLGSRVKSIFKRLTGRGVSLVGNTTNEQVFNFFIDLGFSAEAAAAAVGNLCNEAGMDSSGNMKTNSTESNGEGVGIVQWSYGRKTQFIEYASANGDPWPGTSLGTQLGFLVSELSGGSQWMFAKTFGYDTKYNISYDQFKTCSDIDTATGAWCACFERCKYKNSHLDRRISKAIEVYNQFSGKHVADPNNVNGTNAGAVAGDTTSSNVFNDIISAMDIFDELAKAYGLSSSDGDSTVATMSGTPTATSGGTDQQNQLVDKLKSIQNTLVYSQSGPRDPDQGSADCSSTVGWAYKKVLGVDPGSYTGAMATDSDLYTVTTELDPSKFQPGDILLYNNSSGKIGHVEMYAGNNQTIGHGGGKNGTVKGPTIKEDVTKYRPNDFAMARRWTGFLNTSTVGGAATAAVAGVQGSVQTPSSVGTSGLGIGGVRTTMVPTAAGSGLAAYDNNTGVSLNHKGTSTTVVNKNVTLKNRDDAYFQAMIEVLNKISSNTSNINAIVEILSKIAELQAKQDEIDASTKEGKEQAKAISDRKNALIATLKSVSSTAEGPDDDTSLSEMLKNVDMITRM